MGDQAPNTEPPPTDHRGRAEWLLALAEQKRHYGYEDAAEVGLLALVYAVLALGSSEGGGERDEPHPRPTAPTR